MTNDVTTPPGGTVQFNVTVEPSTDPARTMGENKDARPIRGTSAAARVFATPNADARDRAGQAASVTPPAKIPLVPATLSVKQLHEVISGIAGAGLATVMDAVGEAGNGGVGADVPPQPIVKNVATAAHPAAVMRVIRVLGTSIHIFESAVPFQAGSSRRAVEKTYAMKERKERDY